MTITVSSAQTPIKGWKTKQLVLKGTCRADIINFGNKELQLEVKPVKNEQQNYKSQPTPLYQPWPC